MTNNGTGRKHGRRKIEQKDRSDGVDSETLADYVMGNLPEERKQELDRKRGIDPDLDAEIEILTRAMGEGRSEEGPGEVVGSTTKVDDDHRDRPRGILPDVGGGPTLLFLLPLPEPAGKGQSKGAGKRYTEFMTRVLKDAGVPTQTGHMGENHPDQVPHALVVEVPLLVAEVTSVGSETWLALGSRASSANKITAVAFNSSMRPSLLDQAGEIVDREFPYEPTDEGFARLGSEVAAYLTEKIAQIAQQARIGAATAEPAEGIEDRTELVKFRAMLETAMEEAERELIPRRVIAKAFKVVKDENLKEFLELVKQFTDSQVFTPSDKDYSNLYLLASMIEAGRKLVEGILRIGLEHHPESDMLIRDRIRFLAHSSVAADRMQAKQIVRDKYGSGDSEFQLRSDVSLADVDVYVLALMLDAYHRDGQHEEVIQITTRLVEQNPNNSVALRNHSRAMQRLPSKYKEDQVLAQYKKAILAENAQVQSADWYANALDEYGRRVDALEARVFACMLNLDHADSFAELALLISELVQPQNMVRAKRAVRQLPEGVTADTAVQAIVHANQCKDYGIDEKKMCQAAMLNIGMGVGDIEEEGARLGGELSRKDRAAFVEKLYQQVCSEVTM